ncbi:MAG: 30S ribosomal protein S18 [Candidatus Tagabacteria bacterium RIFCSPLOWO2_01_FULL_42_9]|uniref:Small ribosomal subunit protein bS18 n=1 Tax=Candidatus Tagabacteria bacterium RIFCSPLOWO2_01_FULL_42_9 TaxID=1802296 RepID=A0A1G2LSG0_9BACT|nr:MAG: 30S ribosomal protein S18 [Candidatus Tagabacteria bacterium RIFCSPLOWO2_01_FULL_42_9]
MTKGDCYFCANNIGGVSHSEVEILKRFLDPQAKIMPAKKTGVCAKHQRKLGRAVKRARILSLLPFVGR